MAKDKKWTRNQKMLFWTLIVGALGLVAHFVGKKGIHVEGDIGAIGDSANVFIDKRTGIDVNLYGVEVERRTYAEFNLEQIKKERDNAVKRVEILEAEGKNDDASKALQAFREKGDMAGLQELLIRERDKYKDSLIERNNEIGAVAYLRGDIETALSATEQSLDLDPNGINGLSRKGIILSLQGNLNEAEKTFMRIVNIAEATHNENTMAIGYGNLGVIYNKSGELDKAEEILKKALEINERIGRPDGMTSNYSSLGSIYYIRGELDQAEEMLKKSLEIENKFNHFEGIASDYGNLGMIYQKRRELAKAEEMYKKAIEIDEKLGHLEGMANQYRNLGRVYKQRGDLVKAKEYWEKSRDLYKKIGMANEMKMVEGWIKELGS